MPTSVKVSISGVEKKPIRDSIASLMATFGFRRRNTAEFSSLSNLTPNQAASIISGVYEQEGRHTGVTVTTLKIRSELINVELRTDPYRSI